MSIKLKYSIPDYTDVGEGNRTFFTNFQVNNASGNTIKEFLGELSVEELDQDGGTINCLSFDDAPLLVQSAILRIAGLEWEDVYEAV